MALRAPSRAYLTALHTLLASIPFDVVQAESIEMAQYALAAQQRGFHATLDQWNAEYVLQRRAALTDMRTLRKAHSALYSLIQWHKLARYERLVCNQLDQVYVVSAEDGAALRRIGITTPTPIIPNGVDTAYFAPPADRTSDPNMLLFTGTLDFRPNIDAIRWFVQEVLPRIRRGWPNAYLRIVGRAPAPAVQALAQPHVVEVTGGVADIRPHFAEAAVYVLPMRIGGGVRLKLLEALATETPLVSTSMGADGVEGLVPDRHYLRADDVQSFVDATLRLLGDRDLAQQIAQQGHAFAHERYDWHRIIPELEQAWPQHTPT